jgi:PTH1 family peptidyl-tRNA hydrolase
VVFGLGNPGERYARTRHNVGFQVVDEIAGRLGLEPRRRLFRSYLIAKGRADGRPLALVKPLTFMNESGRVVREALRETDGDVSDILVVCDSLDLAPGAVRLRPAGSAGGHKGIASIVRHLGTDAFPRLLVGIGRPAHRGQVVDYVLDAPRGDEAAIVEAAVRRAADAVLLLLSDGPARVMNDYNRREPPS